MGHLALLVVGLPRVFEAGVERHDCDVRAGADGLDVFAEADEIERVDAGIVGFVVAVALVVGVGEEAELDALAFEDGLAWASREELLANDTTSMLARVGPARWAAMTWPSWRVTMTAPPNRRRWIEAAKPTVVVFSGAQPGCEVNSGEAVSLHR